MKIYAQLSFFCLLITLYLRFVNCSYGCVSLDKYSFEKIVSKFKAAFVKFDAAFPYGKKQDEFEKLCTASHNIDQLLVAEVAVKDYGDKDNAELAEKYGVHKDEYPAVKLFLRGERRPFDFAYNNDDDFTVEKMKEFIGKKSNVYIGLHGCLESFDKIAGMFVNEQDEAVRKSLLEEAEGMWHKAENDSEHQSAEVYIKYMRKILKSDSDFVATETNRLKNILLQGQLSDNKKQELERKVNILRAFRLNDEL